MNNTARTKTQRICYIALMTVLICVCSWITIPFFIPFTMQTFAVFCTLIFLGGKDGTSAIALYLLMGTIGLPVFSGFRGGLDHILGPTGGYLIGFIFCGICYILFEPLILRNKYFLWMALGIGLILCYLVGTLWFVVVYSKQEMAYSFLSALNLCVFPYIIPDCIKMALSVYVCRRIRKQ